jgi:hypothetical protein
VRLKSASRILCALAFAATGVTVFASGASAQTINPNATIDVANLNPVQGEDVLVTNADNDDSRCVGGLAVVFVDGLPPGILSQLVDTPDGDGNWQVTLHVPFQADFANAYVLGPYTLNAFCFEAEEATTGPSAAAEPEFAYVPVVVTVNVPTAPEGPLSPAPVAAPITAAPAFTG